MYIDANLIKQFFSELNNANINYVLIKNIANELPYKLKDGKDIDILVHFKSQYDFENCMVSIGYKKIVPPNGRKNGWSFGYGLKEYQFWQNINTNFNLYIDVFEKLSCKSLTPKMWIPLDETINQSVWSNKVFDEKNGWWIMSDEDIFVYMIIRSIFDKQYFKQEYISDIESKKFYLKSESVKYKLSKVFFKYTERLIYMLEQNRYDEIFKDYITFSNY